MSRQSQPTFIDLFCGAGGLSLGLEMAGWRAAAGIDFDPNAIASYGANHPRALAIHSDVSKLSGKDILRRCALDDVDLVAGGPSCQGFSTHGKRIENDPRNFLFREYVRLVAELQPKFILMENVKGLLTYSGGYFKTLIESSFAKIGYRIESRILCAADFGVPQLRHRIFFVGTRLDLPISFPEPSHRDTSDLLPDRHPYVTVRDALSDLPDKVPDLKSHEIPRYNSAPTNGFQRHCRYGISSDAVTLHHSRPLSVFSYEIISNLTQGQG